MTSQHQRRNNSEDQLGDGLPRPVCQQPDKNSPKECAMQQLAGNQSPWGAFKNRLALVLLTASA